jgi:hypothetical protein
MTTIWIRTPNEIPYAKLTGDESTSRCQTKPIMCTREFFKPVIPLVTFSIIFLKRSLSQLIYKFKQNLKPILRRLLCMKLKTCLSWHIVTHGGIWGSSPQLNTLGKVRSLWLTVEWTKTEPERLNSEMG